MTTGMTGATPGMPPGHDGYGAGPGTPAHGWHGQGTGTQAHGEYGTGPGTAGGAPGMAAQKVVGAPQGHFAPTEVERELAAASAGGDQDAVLDVLARTRLYVLVPRMHADVPDWTAPLPTFRDPASRRTCVPVLTPGLLPPWHPEWVFRAVDLGELARSWPYDARRLAVNHGTAFAVLLDAGPRRSKAWQRADARSGAAREGRLLTDAAGQLHGPLAHGLALGAHLAVNNGIVWNRLGAVYQDYATDRARLRSPWGIQHRADLRDRLGSLMQYGWSGGSRRASCGPATPWPSGLSARPRARSGPRPWSARSPRATPGTGRRRTGRCTASPGTRNGSGPTGCWPRTGGSTRSPRSTWAGRSTSYGSRSAPACPIRSGPSRTCCV